MTFSQTGTLARLTIARTCAGLAGGLLGTIPLLFTGFALNWEFHSALVGVLGLIALVTVGLLEVSLQSASTTWPVFFQKSTDPPADSMFREPKGVHAQKMEAVGRLAGGIAHDFNNLTTVILGYAELAGSSLDEKHPAAADLREIRKAGEAASSLVRQLLAFSRQQLLEPTPNLNLNAVVTNMANLISRTIGDEIKLTHKLDPNLPTIYADGSQMEQILLNLAINSRDAMPQGGEIQIATHQETIGAGEADDFGLPVGRYVALRFRDSGLGMTDKTMASIFEPFFTTKGEGEGSGLGLSTVYGIVKQSRGAISVSSELGKGTEFKVLLPVAGDASAIDEQESSQQTLEADIDPGFAPRVLLAEDDDQLRQVARRMLEPNCESVVEASDGLEALSAFEESPTSFDLVVTDVRMPGLSGIELARKIQETQPGMKILFITGYAREVRVAADLAGTGSPSLAKPFSGQAIRAEIAKLVGGASGAWERN